MKGPDYVVSTKDGFVPHIIDLERENCFKKSYLVYIDDICTLEKYFSGENSFDSINEFLQIRDPIIIAFRNNRKPTRRLKRRTLETKQGKKVLDKQTYQSWIEKFKPQAFADFDTAEIPFSIKSPSSLQEAIKLIKDNQIINTNFINEISSKGFLIKVFNDSYTSQHVSEYDFKCDCCKKYKPDYINHIWSVKEIMALNIIQTHNYIQLYLILENIKKECSS